MHWGLARREPLARRAQERHLTHRMGMDKNILAKAWKAVAMARGPNSLFKVTRAKRQSCHP